MSNLSKAGAKLVWSLSLVSLVRLHQRTLLHLDPDVEIHPGQIWYCGILVIASTVYQIWVILKVQSLLLNHIQMMKKNTTWESPQGFTYKISGCNKQLQSSFISNWSSCPSLGNFGNKMYTLHSHIQLQSAWKTISIQISHSFPWELCTQVPMVQVLHSPANETMDGNTSWLMRTLHAGKTHGDTY